MANDENHTDMKRFWFATYREDVLFHSTPECTLLSEGVDHREKDQFPVAQIPVDSKDEGGGLELKMCNQCVTDERFFDNG